MVSKVKNNQVTELLYQALETEKGGVEVYTTALKCAVNDELKEEWQEYLEQTTNHVKVVSDLLNTMGLDLEAETPGRALAEAHKEIEQEEDEHLYHTAGWTRELWIQSLGMPAVLPPPEEVKEVETAIGAARAKQARAQML